MWNITLWVKYIKKKSGDSLPKLKSELYLLQKKFE